MKYSFCARVSSSGQVPTTTPDRADASARVRRSRRAALPSGTSKKCSGDLPISSMWTPVALARSTGFGEIGGKS